MRMPGTRVGIEPHLAANFGRCVGLRIKGLVLGRRAVLVEQDARFGLAESACWRRSRLRFVQGKVIADAYAKQSQAPEMQEITASWAVAQAFR